MTKQENIPIVVVAQAVAVQSGQSTKETQIKSKLPSALPRD
jgi:hypothetical protein